MAVVKIAMEKDPRLTVKFKMLIEQEMKRREEKLRLHRNARSDATIPDWLKLEVLELCFQQETGQSGQKPGCGCQPGVLADLNRGCVVDLFEMATEWQGGSNLPQRESNIKTLTLAFCLGIIKGSLFGKIMSVLQKMEPGQRHLSWNHDMGRYSFAGPAKNNVDAEAETFSHV